VTANSAESYPTEAGSISVLLNSGHGSFRTRHEYNPCGVRAREGYDVSSVAIGDLNGDGKPELVVAGGAGGGGCWFAAVLLNRGDGRFGVPLEYRTGGNPDAPVIADLNGDGKRDLTVSQLTHVSVLVNTPGLCNVQRVVRMTLAAARQKIARANCRVGKVSRAYSKRVRRGRIVSQKPKFGAVLPQGGKVNLVISRGRRK
jgi:PASTA domain/FG-GAP-like repeat